MDGDDELFGPKPSATLSSQPPTAPSLAPATDVRAVPRAIGALLCALGRPTDAEIARANGGLQRLSRPLLTARDRQLATPESLAPFVPVEARVGVLALMRQIAADQPIRARLALSYAQLWSANANANADAGADADASPSTATAGPVVRWLVGKLPSHVTAPESPPSDGPYRSGDVRGPEPAARTDGPRAPTLRDRVERIRAQFASVLAAVEHVI
ncbi:MAG: hypothetical protein ACXVAN_08320, partial [Polyangia bacterium]